MSNERREMQLDVAKALWLTPSRGVYTNQARLLRNNIAWRALFCFLSKLERINPLNAELNPIRHLLALVVARHIVVSRVRVKE